MKLDNGCIVDCENMVASYIFFEKGYKIYYFVRVVIFITGDYDSF